MIFTLAQLSYWSAKHLGDAGLQSMQVRGRLQEGMVADIVIFDPETVREKSDYKAGEQGLPPVGLPHVIVNGVFVKRDDQATNAFPGQPIRYPVEDKPRHVAASQKQWLRSFSIDGGALAPRASADTVRRDSRSAMVLPASRDAGSANIESRVRYDPLTMRLDAQGVWFAEPGEPDYSSLAFCELHQRYEDPRMAVRELGALPF